MLHRIPRWLTTTIVLLTPIWGPFVLITLAERMIPSLGMSDGYSIAILTLPVIVGSLPIWFSEAFNTVTKLMIGPIYCVVGAITCGLSTWASLILYGHH